MTLDISETTHWQIDMIEEVQAGRISWEQAEAEAQQQRMPPFVVWDSPLHLRNFEKAFWPVDLVIAYIISPNPSAAIRRWREHRFWTEKRSTDGWPDAASRLQEAFRCGALRAFGKRYPDDTRVEIPQLDWIDLRITQIGQSDYVCELSGAIKYYDVQIARAEVEAAFDAAGDGSISQTHQPDATDSAASKIEIPITETPQAYSASAPEQNQAIEATCETFLSDLMREHPDRPASKKAVFEEVNQRLQKPISRRKFDRLWGNATVHQPNWCKAGRRPSSNRIDLSQICPELPRVK
ncbi:hypothetical protein [Methylocella sp. CPCC 101449]|uniref:hypothetical protein n=1 Tax=Methylocella sp. CPCC 101449 TaxID=2987531 RepID=UPI00288D4671|nr:hypothetical protein [Methylocella sp. CPCC 101449]MDT2021229.1 hypothetical protein [Methylocella sp. CPCC 101449]